jgi:hypothetical protein
MNSIYGLLESSDCSSFESGQILKLCEYVQENDSPTQPCGATRILLQMALYAKASDVCISISRIYATIISASDVELSEFALLGGGIVQLCSLLAEYGATALRGCCVDLPFSDLDCEPRKYALSITSQKSLERLMAFWCCTAQHLFEDASQYRILCRYSASILQSLAELSSVLAECSMGSDVVAYLCAAAETVAAAIPASEGSPGAGCLLKISSGLLGWVEMGLKNAGDKIAQNAKGPASSSARCSDGVDTAMLAALQRCVSTLANLLYSAGAGPADSRSSSASTESLLAAVLSLLQRCVVPHAQAIAAAECGWWTSLSEKAARSAAKSASSRSPSSSSAGLVLQAATSSSSACSLSGSCEEEGFVAGAAVQLVRLLQTLATRAPAASVTVLQTPHALGLLQSLCASLPLLDAVAGLLTTLRQTAAAAASAQGDRSSQSSSFAATLLLLDRKRDWAEHEEEDGSVEVTVHGMAQVSSAPHSLYC